MKVRRARGSDLPDVSRLYFQLHPDLRKRGAVQVLTTTVREVILVAEDRGRVIGFVWANLLTYGRERVGSIEELYVDPKARKQGVGTALVAEVLRRLSAWKADAVFVSTMPRDRVAWRFYRGIGFWRCRGPWWVWTPETGGQKKRPARR